MSMIDGKAIFTGQMDAPLTTKYFDHKRILVDYSLQFSAPQDDLVVEAVLTKNGEHVNFMALSYDSAKDEQIYGLGLQCTIWDFKGKTVPVITAEQGVGRGLQPVTVVANLMGGQGGNEMTAYTSSYNHITNNQRAFFFNTTALGLIEFNLYETTAIFWKTKSIQM
jgi:hypothetical protein